VRPAANEHRLTVPMAMVVSAAGERVAEIRATSNSAADARRASRPSSPRGARKARLRPPVVAGLGVFCGCVGKSAQFPLHVWLPDAWKAPRR